jgi:large subunit ribosomal protein L11
MAKEIKQKLKLQIPAGKAVPAPPLGPALGQAGINIGEFTKQFNDATKDKMGDIIPVIVNVYDDRSYDITYKTPPASSLILKALNLKSGSGKPNTKKVGTITKAQVEEIANIKMEDLSATSLEAASKIIEGTCRSMGVDVK